MGSKVYLEETEEISQESRANGWPGKDSPMGSESSERRAKHDQKSNRRYIGVANCPRMREQRPEVQAKKSRLCKIQEKKVYNQRLDIAIVDGMVPKKRSSMIDTLRVNLKIAYMRRTPIGVLWNASRCLFLKSLTSL